MLFHPTPEKLICENTSDLLKKKFQALDTLVIPNKVFKKIPRSQNVSPVRDLLPKIES
jgi:hypothetical protein